MILCQILTLISLLPAIPLSKRKDTRKVEIAWIHKGKQVRKRTGGGTRKVDVSRDARKSDLLHGVYVKSYLLIRR